jgi:hypothetical protein
VVLSTPTYRGCLVPPLDGQANSRVIPECSTGCNGVAYCLNSEHESGSESPTDNNTLWELLSKSIRHVSAGNALPKIFRLVFDAHQPLDQKILPRIASLLTCSVPFASKLQEVRIENLSVLNETSYDLDVILDACPMLRELSLTGLADGHVQVGLSKDHTLWTRTASDRPLMLQSLTMKSILVSQRFLNIMISASPHLVKLELYAMYLGKLNATTGRFEREPIQRIEFFHHVGRSCPRLEFVQVSFCGVLLEANEMDDFRSTFATTPHWSFSRDDFLDEGLRNFLLPRRSTDMNYLRGLEIHPEGTHIGIHKALHAYLTSPQAATLVHLKIMGANYPLSYFESGFLAPETAWTCKSLQTLHLRAYHETGSVWPNGLSQDPANKWLSRHIFIGLTGAFVKMRDLRMDCPNIDFSLEGGMCLLRRMSDLQRLRVKSMRERQFTERDLAWLHPDPTSEQRAVNAEILAEVQDQVRVYRGGINGRAISEKMSRGYIRRERDQSIAGTLEQVADLLEEIHTLGVAGKCLPYLESLIVEQGRKWDENTHGRQQEQTRKIVKRMKGSFFFHLTMEGAPPKLGVGP